MIYLIPLACALAGLALGALAACLAYRPPLARIDETSDRLEDLADEPIPYWPTGRAE